MALGGDDQAVKLTTHDIRNEACSAVWNQRQVRAGQVTSGYWAVDVKEAGRYQDRAEAMARGDRLCPDRGDRRR